ncbi:molybdopterin cofactor-binding domain-containing protein [Mesorhizobium atlanticum]
MSPAAASWREPARWSCPSPSLPRRRNLRPAAPAATEKPKLPGSLDDTPSLDAWIRIDADGTITVFTGKAELGQGTKTSLRQIAAEELEVEPASIKLITADTALTPNEGYTAGSQTIQNSGTAIRYASAQVRQILIAKASEKLGAPIEALKAQAGVIIGLQRRQGQLWRTGRGRFPCTSMRRPTPSSSRPPLTMPSANPSRGWTYRPRSPAGMLTCRT